MADYKVFNGSAAELTNIDGSTDIAPGAMATVTLTNAQLAAALAFDSVAVLSSTGTVAEEFAARKALAMGSQMAAVDGDGTADGSLINDAGDPGLDD